MPLSPSHWPIFPNRHETLVIWAVRRYRCAVNSARACAGLGFVAESASQDDAILNRKASSLPEIGRRRMGCVADQPDPADGPDFRRRAIDNIIAKHPLPLCTCDQFAHGVGPATEKPRTIDRSSAAKRPGGELCVANQYTRLLVSVQMPKR